MLDLPANCDQVKVVDSLKWLLKENFSKSVNAIVFPRALAVDFRAAVAPRRERYDVENIPGFMRKERAAYLRFLLEEMKFLEENGFSANAFVQRRKAYGSSGDRFHEDRGFPQGKVLCTYIGASTEYLNNEDTAYRKSALYEAKPGVDIHMFGVSNIWRFAAKDTKGAKRPLVHRRPMIVKPRLVLEAF